MILQGDTLRLPLRSGSVHCAITSPPYWSLRRYSAENHLGLEKSPTTYVYKLVRVFREVRRVLRDDGVLWVNLGDAYASPWACKRRNVVGAGSPSADVERGRMSPGLKEGDLCGLPFRVVSALQADGWWWRATVIVAKKNPMPESVQSVRWEQHRVKTKPGGTSGDPLETNRLGRGVRLGDQPSGLFAGWSPCPGCPTCSPNDGLILRRGSWRPTTSHEYIFMLSKSQRYWADGEAVKEVSGGGVDLPERHGDGETVQGTVGGYRVGSVNSGRNFRSVLSLATQPYAWAMCKACQEIYSPERFRRLHRDNGRRVCACGAKDWLSHYATFPEALVEPLIKASTSERGCCPTCGAGWARVVERKSMEIARTDWGEQAGNRTAPSGTMLAPAESRTLAWRATCACPPLPPIPAVVLDPFSGAGTVAFVAAKLGRKGIGVDLSWEYSRMAEARFAKGESWDPPEVPEGQMVLGV